jgi:ArsR family transcriptional regulator
MKKSTAIAALAALAQETRLDIFRLLVQKGPGGMPAGDIGERLGLPSPTLSFHLNQLRHAGLIRSHRESRSIIYAANYEAMSGLLAYLTENCCAGNVAACGSECGAQRVGGQKPLPRSHREKAARPQPLRAFPA